MQQLTVSIHLDDQVFKILTRYAAIAHRDIGAVVSELITEQLADLSLRVEAEQIRTLPLAERRALARGAWGSWALTDGTNSVDVVRQLRAEWTH